MKNQTLLTILLLLGFLVVQPIFAGGNNSADTKKSIEANLLIGVKSDNEGLKVSSAYYLGELRTKDAVIPLMKILREGNSDAARIIAALSLIKIEDPQGLFMVKRTAKFNDFERVRKISEHFYNAYIANKHAGLKKDKSNIIADL